MHPVPHGMKHTLVAALLLLAALPAAADETVTLLCTFEHGEILVDVNYTRETANGATAMISDKEIVWSPPGGNKGLARFIVQLPGDTLSLFLLGLNNLRREDLQIPFVIFQ